MAGSRAAEKGRRDRLPVFVANGDRDPMILPHYSYLLAGLSRTRTDLYPDSAHGFLFQHTPVAADVDTFLAEGG